MYTSTHLPWRGKDIEHTKELIKLLELERRQLALAGHFSPALFEVVILLLRKHGI